MTITQEVATLFGHACGALEVQCVAVVAPQAIIEGGFTSYSDLVKVDVGDNVASSIRDNLNPDSRKAFEEARMKAVKHYCSFLHQMPDEHKLAVLLKIIELETGSHK